MDKWEEKMGKIDQMLANQQDESEKMNDRLQQIVLDVDQNLKTVTPPEDEDKSDSD